MIRNCVICGKTFTPHSNNQKTCSKECSRENCRRLWRKYQQRVASEQKQKTIPTSAICHHCGKSFAPAYPKEKFCSNDCRFKFFRPPLINAFVKVFLGIRSDVP